MIRRHSLSDFNYFKCAMVCILTQNVVYHTYWLHWKRLAYSAFVECVACYINLITLSWLLTLFKSSIIITDFLSTCYIDCWISLECLLERRMLKSTTVIVYWSISPFNSVRFWFNSKMCWGAYTLRLNYTCLVALLYHNISSFNIYFIWYYGQSSFLLITVFVLYNIYSFNFCVSLYYVHQKSKFPIGSI